MSLPYEPSSVSGLTVSELVTIVSNARSDALELIRQVWKRGRSVDREVVPSGDFGELTPFLDHFYQADLKGERLARLWELCQYDLVRLIAVYRASQLNLAGVDQDWLKTVTNGGCSEGPDWDSIFKEVKAQVKSFDPQT